MVPRRERQWKRKTPLKGSVLTRLSPREGGPTSTPQSEAQGKDAHWRGARQAHERVAVFGKLGNKGAEREGDQVLTIAASGDSAGLSDGPSSQAHCATRERGSKTELQRRTHRVKHREAKKGGSMPGQPDRKPSAGEGQAALAKNRLFQWWQSVNDRENLMPRIPCSAPSQQDAFAAAHHRGSGNSEARTGCPAVRD